VALQDQRRGRLDALRPDHYQALGKLLLTFILLWAYTGFSQYIVIWSGDLPREVTWYVARTQGGWGALALTLVFGTFAIPTLLLFFRPVKRSGRALAIIGSVLLVLHALDMLWVVVPGQMPMRVWTAVMFAAALVVVGGGTAAVAEWRQRGRPLVAIRDPLLLASEQYRAG
jgi:DMSO/TMAO reductase YedYZ heme-binding membrane subunit